MITAIIGGALFTGAMLGCGTASADAYYKNCTAAWNAGVAPLHDGDDGYEAPRLDRDSDGVDDADEIASGSDPGSAASVPAGLQIVSIATSSPQLKDRSRPPAKPSLIGYTSGQPCRWADQAA